MFGRAHYKLRKGNEIKMQSKIKVVREYAVTITQGKPPVDHVEKRVAQLFRGRRSAWEIWRPLHEVKPTDIVTGL
jgi:hypothetical protein